MTEPAIEQLNPSLRAQMLFIASRRGAVTTTNHNLSHPGWLVGYFDPRMDDIMGVYLSIRDGLR